jgi:hypothetical protein
MLECLEGGQSNANLYRNGYGYGYDCPSRQLILL